MSLPSSNNFTDVNNLFLNDSLGIQFTGRSSDPTDSDLAAGRLYFNSVAAGLKYYNGSSWVTIPTASSGAVPSWETIELNDSVFALSSSPFTITQSSANSILSLTKTNAGAGAVIAITNSGTGNDVTGTSGLWSVNAAGLATFATNSIISGTLKVGSGGADAVITSNGANSLLVETASGVNSSTLTLAAGVNGNITATMNGTGAVIITGTTTGNTALNVNAGDLLVTAGQITGVKAANTSNLLLTNNTLTTFGMAVLRSTSVTSGVLLRLQADESVVGGFTGAYLDCFNSSGSSVFTVSKFGATVIAGLASGTAVLTLVAGDLFLADGQIYVTRVGDDAATLSVVNNTVATVNHVSISGSGAFSGSGANSFVLISPSGLTSGTALRLTLGASGTSGKALDISTALTTGVVATLSSSAAMTGTGQLLALTANSATTTTSGLVSLAANALSTGHGVLISSTSAALASGKLLDLSVTSSGALAAKTGAELNIAVSMTHTLNSDVTQNFNDLSISRTVVRNVGGGDTFTTLSQGALISLSNVITATTGTITDTVNGLAVVMSANGTGNAIALTHNSTTAVVLSVTSSGVSSAGVVKVTANSLTSGNALLISATNAYAGTGIVTLTATGLTTGSAVLVSGGGANMLANGKCIEVAMGAATAGNGLTLSSSGVYAGTGLLVLSANGLTTGFGISTVHTTSVIASGGSLLNLSSSGVNIATSTGCLVNLANSGSLVGTQVLFTDTAITTGCVMKLTHTAGVIASGGSMLRVGTTTVDTSTTTGVLLDLTATAATLGNLCMLTSATLTSGSGLVMTLNGLTSGSGLVVLSSSADTSARGLVQLSGSSALATGCAAIRTTMSKQSVHFVRLITDSTTGVTLWLSDGTTANANLAATTGDFCLNAGANKPEYCTNGAGSLWTAVV